MHARPGEIWLADLGLAAKARPVAIVPREDENPPRALIIYVPLTTQYRGSAYEVPFGRISFLREISYANTQGIGSIPSVRLERKIGNLSAVIFDHVHTALRFALGL